MIIYITTNLINGIKYIGKDANNNSNYIGSGTNLKKAIKEFGKENFRKDIIEYCIDINNLIEREIYWLEFYDAANNSQFYNLTNKAFGNSGLSEETKNKISKSLKGIKKSQKTKDNISLGRIGIKHTKHTQGKDHKTTGKKRSQEVKDRKSKEMRDVIRTQEWKDNIRNNRENCIKAKIKKVQQFDLNDNLIKEWNSMTEARNETKITGIPHCAGGFIKKAGGYKWKYKN